MSCPFCDRNQIEDRIYYENTNWIGFLAAPYNTWGHSIIAAKKQREECPTAEVLNWRIPLCFDSALDKVANSLMEYLDSKPKNILMASVRGDIRHFHFHLIPLWADEEMAWRLQQRYEDPGHLLEYLGFQEKAANEKALFERIKNGWDGAEQRAEITKTLKSAVEELRMLTGYISNYSEPCRT
jgi:diadenosine tetraphosphate (Ap4A) HIT family hydrolase